jgi:glycolate oxidase FAD binding subunit
MRRNACQDKPDACCRVRVSLVPTTSIAAKFESIVGRSDLRTEAHTVADYAVDGATPKFVVRPENAAQAAEIVRAAVEEKFSVIPCGARTALGVGMPPASYDVALDMSRVTGIAHYDAGDLTISVNAGLPLAELASVLAEKNQFLPLTVPFFERATIGGAIAAGLDSPLRHSYGTPRDFLLGAEFVDGTGALAKSGGRVVKNVTGYDFHKLFNGSLGTLAVVTRLNFRTFPLPHARRGFLASVGDEAAAIGFAKELSRSALMPTVLEILSPESATLFFEEKSPLASLRMNTQAWTICAGFEGSEEICERYARELSSLARTACAENAVTLHDHQFASVLELLREAPAMMSRAAKQAVVMRYTVLPSQLPDLLRALRSFVESSWMTSAALVRSSSILYFALLPREGEETAQKQVAYFWKSVGSLRGKLEFRGSLLFCPFEWKAGLNVWAHVDSDIDLERRVKKAFDPNGTFARGRFVGGI